MALFNNWPFLGLSQINMAALTHAGRTGGFCCLHRVLVRQVDQGIPLTELMCRFTLAKYANILGIQGKTHKKHSPLLVLSYGWLP